MKHDHEYKPLITRIEEALKKTVPVAHLPPNTTEQELHNYRMAHVAVTQVQGSSLSNAVDALRFAADDAHPYFLLDSCHNHRPLTLREIAELTTSDIRGLNVIQTDFIKLRSCTWPTSSAVIANETGDKFKVCPDAFPLLGTEKRYHGSYDAVPGTEFDFKTWMKEYPFDRGMQIVDAALDENNQLRRELTEWLGRPVEFELDIPFPFYDQNARKRCGAAYLMLNTPADRDNRFYRLIQIMTQVAL